LGRAEWALAAGAGSQEAGTVLSRDGTLLASFVFEETLRPQAQAAIAALRSEGIAIALLSGDTQAAVHSIAARLGIGTVAAGLLPAQKVARLAALAAQGHKVLMIGDGLNDAPALAAAHVSIAPASAADIGRNAADFVFLHDGLDAIPTTLKLARGSA
ncbi:HAD-IC family P-type ATPase, partial [Bosea sp. 2YAB26]|uniref:HAD-IC family P-type ATPase n=1 Tax=Bosea sp. 2YAB26 TaxID=3237478 RepID=UPI003F8FF119